MNRTSFSLHRWTFGLACLLIAGPAVSTALAQGDPVESLRKALTMTRTPDDPAFKRRHELARKAAAELHTIQHLRRAYFLGNWPASDDQAKLNDKEDLGPIQFDIGERLIAAVKRAKSDAAAAAVLPDESIRKAAEVKLLAIAMLIAELADSDPVPDRRRDKLARKLTDVAIELSAHPSIAVKQTALHALGKVTPPPAKAIKVLQARVADRSEPGPRGVAAYALIDLVKYSPALLSKEEFAQTIQGVLQTAQVGLADTTAEETLRGYCLLAIRDAIRALDEWAQQPGFLDKEVAADAQKVLALGEVVGASLSKALEEPSPNIRAAALDALVQLAQLRARPGLRLDAKDALPDPLGRAALETRIKQIAHVLVNKNAEDRERRSALAFLELLGPDSRPALPEITVAMCDPDALVRYAAARVIRYFPYLPDRKTTGLTNETVEALGKLLLDGDPDVNLAAAASLEAIGPPAAIAIESLARALTFGDTENRLAVFKLVANLGSPITLRTYPAVVASLTHDDPRLTRQAAETLGQFGAIAQREDATTDAALRQLIDSFRAAALPALTRSLRDADAETRLNASEAILSLTPVRKGL